MGLAPTGRRVSVEILSIGRMKDGKAIEHWGGPDIGAIMAQLGVDSDCLTQSLSPPAGTLVANHWLISATADPQAAILIAWKRMSLNCGAV